MVLKKDSNSLGSEQEKSQNEDSSLIEFKNLENKKEIESQLLEVSKGDSNENGFLDFGFNQSILNSLIKKGYKNPTHPKSCNSRTNVRQGFTRPSTNRNRKDCSFRITINRKTYR